MNKFKLIMYSILSISAVLLSWVLFFLADHISKFAAAWDLGADHYHNKVMERI